ncbi:MAG TPA: 30S ribosomal protein S6 [Gemmataceae bacterium]|nr:30S ribosomal protein S6 [Gemmataceae bacterium]
MPANVYECMFLLDTNKVAGDVPSAAKQLHGILERNQAEVLASRPWDERRLAFPINGHKKGLYYLTYFRTEGKNVAGIEHDCSLNETIMRALILKVDPKHVDIMLQLARDEHAVALQTVTEPPPDEDGLGGSDLHDGDRGHRRAPRRKEEHPKDER